MNNRFIAIAILVILAAFSRLLPHPANVSPIAAMALFGGAMFGKRILAFFVPFAAMFVSDLIIGFHDQMVGVYLAFGLTVLLGFLLQNNKSFVRVTLLSIIGSVVFFLVTNFQCWFNSTGFYSSDFGGLMTSYSAGLPFFRNTMAGDLFFNGVLFGGFYLMQQRFPKLARIK